MAVSRCHECEQDPLEKRRYGGSGLAEGSACPICYQPTCRYHLTTVRWRWRDGGQLGDTLICKACKRSYAHRSWDVANRDWIT
ncbi:MAG: hypothetical protein H6988_08205 [Pseudomonadales bacterium]|nr:hypothetical protein [Anaerolineales bacterium]MCB8916563.1 hypothetical protein [Ardenticatenaceae bacterium]MCP5190360.1 hypothetical protein [Pseudomonadales bacterium]